MSIGVRRCCLISHSPIFGCRRCDFMRCFLNDGRRWSHVRFFWSFRSASRKGQSYHYNDATHFIHRFHQEVIRVG